MRPAHVSYYLRRIREIPLASLPRVIRRVLARALRNAAIDRAARRRAGFARDKEPPKELRPVLPALPPGPFAATARQAMADRLASGNFDVLGSGWLPAHRNASAPGFEEHRYDFPAAAADPRAVPVVPDSERTETELLWRHLDRDYLPLDWHRDLRSGFRWPPTAWCRDISFGADAGADVKSPWELGRLQHLPLLAIAAATSRDAADRYGHVLQNQIVDFIASNPPGFGVQWACAMDVAIRIANLLLALDLARALGRPVAAWLQSLVARSALEHGRHILLHVEWDAELRGNHYLCDLAGLAFCAAYLPQNAETDAWLAYAAANLASEAERQFDPQGCNFEASTSYHRLSAETLIYATAALSSVPVERWRKLGESQPALADVPGWSTDVARRLADWANGAPAALLARITGAAEVTAELAADGRVPQIGDNDSGRFAEIEPALAGDGLTRDTQDHRHLLAAASGLTGRADLAAQAAPFALDAIVVRGLAGRVPSAAGGRSSHHAAPFTALPGLGLHVWRRPRFALFVRCGAIGQNGHGGHAHNDQLSFELWVDGAPVLVDPGTYVYTPDPRRRNAFRATAAHNTLWVEGREQNRFSGESLFFLHDDARGRVIEASNERFTGAHQGFGTPHTRRIDIRDADISVHDECATSRRKGVALTLAPDVEIAVLDGPAVRLRRGSAVLKISAPGVAWTSAETGYSPAYGRRVPTRRLTAEFSGPSLAWRVAVADRR